MDGKAREDYLRAIYHLEEEQEQDPSVRGVSSAAVAGYLHVSKSSVSEMVGNLGREGFVQPVRYGKIRLTRKGRAESTAITRRHRIIEVFLSDVLRLKGGLVHEEAHRLEHAFSDESIDSIARLIRGKRQCPHGKKIPA